MANRLKLYLISCMLLLETVACARQKSPDDNVIDNDTWNVSQWISVVDAPVVTDIITDKTRAADGASWFASIIENEKNIESAIWITTGLGVYDLYINGHLVGEDILKPGFSHCQKTKYSFSYDITESIFKGKGEKNVFAAEVTPGWWADKIVTHSGNNGFVGKKCAFRCVLKVSYEDGSEKMFGSNTLNWVAGIAGNVKHAAIFDGEVYDARMKPGFESIDELKTPEINSEFDGQIIPNPGAEVFYRRDLKLEPVSAYLWEGIIGESENEFGKVVIREVYAADDSMTLVPGQSLVVDFGQNCTAVPSFVFSAKEGTSLVCLPSEMLNDLNGKKEAGMDGPEGSVYRANLRIPESGMFLEYIFAGREEETFLPRKTFFGYRYVSLTSTDTVVIKSICSIPVSSISKEMEIGKIETGNNFVNKLISNTLWGQRSNYLSVPTDCPQRNERLGWTGDTQVFAETGTFFANTNYFFHKWLQDLRDSQSFLGGYPAVAPYAQYGADEFEMMRVGWADAGIIVPFVIWKQFGDISILEDSWSSMECFMKHVANTKYDHNALKNENGNVQYADWLSYEPLGTWLNFHLDENGIKQNALDYWNFLSASYWLLDAECMFYMAEALKKDTDKYSNMIIEARNYIRDSFFTKDGDFKTEILNTMQTPALFALRNKIFSGEAKKRIITRLRENFTQHDNCLQTGFLGTSILMQTLTENGMSDIAYELLLNEKNPSWLYSVINGATTIWERWDSYVEGVGMINNGMNSFNHYSYGCVCQWIWETVAGISSDPAISGFKHIIMKPLPDKRLGFVSAEYQSAAGLITSSWRYEGEEWIWDFTIPAGATASITIPGENEVKTYIAGTYTIRRGVTSVDFIQNKEQLKTNTTNCNDKYYRIDGILLPNVKRKGLYIVNTNKVLAQ